jgi:hypothetical protein
MDVNVTVHGLLTAAVLDPGGRMGLTLADATTIEGMVDGLRERSSLFDPRSCIAVMDGVKVSLDRVLEDGDEVHLYPIFGGG